jgi:sulfite reductase (NADPH) flavoprotein alpha-component
MNVMTDITIAFGSETGTSEGLAQDAAKILTAKGYNCHVIDLEDFTLDILIKIKLLLLITSTFGEGEPPTNAELFYDELMSTESTDLSQLQFSVCALGDRSYEFFCQCGKDFDHRLGALGGQRLASRADCDTDCLEYDDWWTSVENALDKLHR